MKFTLNTNMNSRHATDGAKGCTSAFGIAHKYADPDLIDKEREAFRNAMERKQQREPCGSR